MHRNVATALSLHVKDAENFPEVSVRYYCLNKVPREIVRNLEDFQMSDVSLLPAYSSGTTPRAQMRSVDTPYVTIVPQILEATPLGFGVSPVCKEKATPASGGGRNVLTWWLSRLPGMDRGVVQAAALNPQYRAVTQDGINLPAAVSDL